MFSGRLDEHMRFSPPILLTDMTQFMSAHGDVALSNNMLNDYKKTFEGGLKFHKHSGTLCDFPYFH
jgi:hypothetical protein